MSRLLESLKRRRWSDDVLVVLLVLYVVTLWLLVGPPIKPWVERRSAPDPAIRGRVVDARTGRGLPGATVLVRSHSKFAILDPDALFKPKRSRAVGMTDSTGAFVVMYRKLDWTDASFVAPGFASVVARHEPRPWSEVRMRRSSRTAREIYGLYLSFDVARSSRTISFDLDNAGRETTDSTLAEFALVQDSLSIGDFGIRAVGPVGLAPIQRGRQHIEGWDHDCEAPQSSYVRSMRLPSASNGFYYTRLDGSNRRRYGQLTVSISTVVAASKAQGGIVASVGVSYTVNPTGTREVCREPQEGEADVLAEIESVRNARH